MGKPLGYRNPVANLFRELSRDFGEASQPFGPQNIANFNMVGNYANAGGTSPEGAVDFYIKAPQSLTLPNGATYNDVVYALHRVLILVTDNNATNSSHEYISNAPLTIGINGKLNTQFGEALVTHDKIKSYADWASYAGVDVRAMSNGNSASRSWVTRWSIDKSGAPTYLRGSAPVQNGQNGVDFGEELIVTLNDDFSSLQKHTMLVQGVIYFANK